MGETVKLSKEFIAQYKGSMHSSVVERYAEYLDSGEAPKELIIGYYRYACCQDYRQAMLQEFPFLKGV
jgi:hypothetical protein